MIPEELTEPLTELFRGHPALIAAVNGAVPEDHAGFSQWLNAALGELDTILDEAELETCGGFQKPKHN